MGLLTQAVLFSVSLVIPTFSFNPMTLPRTDATTATADSSWIEGLVTWYGEPTGPGSEGGACGYKSAVSSSPLSSMIAAAYPKLYSNGEGCGECFQIKCLQTTEPLCSGNPINITISDSCQSCGEGHFDLSGTAFGELSVPGNATQFRALDQVNMTYQRIECQHGSTNLTFKMDRGANNYVPAVLIEFEDGNGEIVAVKLIDMKENVYEMKRSWGAVWSCDASNEAKPPYSFNVIDGSGNVVNATNVVPENWVAEKTYTAAINFIT